MKLRMSILTACGVVCVLAAGTAWAKRTRPPQVEPVVHEGVKYVAPNDVGRRAYVQAYDVATSNKLWEATVFNTKINPLKEADVQWIYIRRLQIHGAKLLVTDEGGRQFLVGLSDKKVEQLKNEKLSSNVTFAIYSIRTNDLTQIFLKVSNNSETPYKMEEPHGGAVMPNYFRYYKSKDGKWGQAVDPVAPGSRVKGPMVTIVKGKPYHFKLYDLCKDFRVTIRVKYTLDSGESVYTNELEINTEQTSAGDSATRVAPGK